MKSRGCARRKRAERAKIRRRSHDSSTSLSLFLSPRLFLASLGIFAQTSPAVFPLRYSPRGRGSRIAKNSVRVAGIGIRERSANESRGSGISLPALCALRGEHDAALQQQQQHRPSNYLTRAKYRRRQLHGKTDDRRRGTRANGRVRRGVGSVSYPV